ncbi:MAG TPA: DUF11 domain-containing protein, partial [Verrucomicrobiae bacterium]|nr:DUF11 domain-containing protein [Verrucomicrobiae bacterium]
MARRGALATPGPVWTFRTRGLGPLHHFAWEPVSELQQRNAAIPVVLTARDDLDNVLSDFFGSVRLRATRRVETPPVQILSYVEFADLNRRYRNTLAAIATYFTNFNHSSTVATDPSTLQSLLVGKDVFLIPAQNFAPAGRMAELGESWRSVLQAFVSDGGVVIACSLSKDEHKLMETSGLLTFDEIGKNAGQSALELVPNPADPLSAGLAGPFTGFNVVTYNSDEPGVAVRSADKNLPVVLSRPHGSGLAVMIGTDYATNRTGLDRIIANAVARTQERDLLSVPVAPGQSGFFLEGRWDGAVTLGDTGSGVVLIAETEAGPSGASNPFEVISQDDLSVTVTDAPDPLLVGQILTYEIEVRYTGLSVARDVVLTNLLPQGLEFLSISATPGGCALRPGGVLECGLGTMNSGSPRFLAITGRTLRAGWMTNEVRVAGVPGEEYLNNNTATAVTRVNP